MTVEEEKTLFIKECRKRYDALGINNGMPGELRPEDRKKLELSVKIDTIKKINRSKKD